jgi:UDP-glucuronate 4-epimerase|tara:strand:+ start:863 stop:1879 length:1017 start_codon:yes stop_codon:yes gene_type:complete
MRKVLVTGSAGFIGFHLTKALLDNNFEVVGVDNLNDYYDPALKQSRLDSINQHIEDHNWFERYHFFKLDISDDKALDRLFSDHHFDIVINLAAQAGVRYSIENPKAYVNSNLVGFANILECCRHGKIDHLLFASSSSVYGMNVSQPFDVSDNTDFPISLYAATKKSNELLAHSYSHLYNIPCTGLRFFTVYGPYGRPDMAYYSFSKAISEGVAIDVFNNGEMERDFTYIDDIVFGIVALVDQPPPPQSSKITKSQAPFKVFNIGNNNPISLRRFIRAIESALGKKAVERMLPMQPGDVPSTFANIDDLIAITGFTPATTIEDGISKFIKWYKSKSDRT